MDSLNVVIPFKSKIIEKPCTVLLPNLENQSFEDVSFSQ